MDIRILLFIIKEMEVRKSKFWLKELSKFEIIYMWACIWSLSQVLYAEKIEVMGCYRWLDNPTLDRGIENSEVWILPILESYDFYTVTVLYDLRGKNGDKNGIS